MSNKKNLFVEEMDFMCRKLLISVGIFVVGGMLFGVVKVDEKCVVKVKLVWDKLFIGEILEKLLEGYNILLVVIDQECFFFMFFFLVFGREWFMKMGVIFCNYQNISNVCMFFCFVLYIGLYMFQIKMFDNLGLFWMFYDFDFVFGIIGYMMWELGYYMVYKGKWYFIEKLEKFLFDEKDEDIDVGDIFELELYKIMEKYGFFDYYGIGDIIGYSKGGYFYDLIIMVQIINWLRCKGQFLND